MPGYGSTASTRRIQPVQQWLAQVEELWRRQLQAFKAYAESIAAPPPKPSHELDDTARVSVTVAVPPAAGIRDIHP